MTSLLYILLQSAIPVPATPPPILDHRIACNLFGADAALGRITAETVAESAALARLTMAGSAKGLPLPPSNASALSQDGVVAVRSGGRGTKYNWMFKVPTRPASNDGLVTVTARTGMGPVRYIATGICTVASTKAVYQ